MQYSSYIREAPGADTAVLFVHGIVGTPAHFRALLPLVPDPWSVYNILLEGHGGMVRDFSRASMVAWKEQVSRQLDEILTTHGRVYIAGHSMGALFAIQEAIRRPQQVMGLFLLAVPLFPKLPPSTMLHSLQAALGWYRPGSAAEKMVADSGVHLSKNLFLYLGWIPRFWELLAECRATRPLLPHLTVPCRCYQSRKDELVSSRSGRLLRNCPDITVTELATSGHFAYSSADTQFLKEEFQRFLQIKNADIG